MGPRDQFDYQKAVLKQTEEAKVFKKTFLAVAVGAALGATGANAAELTLEVLTSTNDWTVEGAADLANLAVPDVKVTLGKEYTPNDVITFTWNKDVAGEPINTINVDDGLVGTAPGAFTMTLGLVAYDTTYAQYRVTELTSTGSGSATAISTDGATFTLTSETGSDFLVAAADIANDDDALTLNYASETSDTNLALEATTATTQLDGFFTFTTQYADTGANVATSDFSKEIDVERGIATGYELAGTAGSVGRANLPPRAVFSDGTAVDSATIDLGAPDTLFGENDSGDRKIALTTGLSVTLAGDFTFLAATLGTGVDTGDELYANLEGTGTVSGDLATDKKSVTFTWQNLAGLDVNNEVGFFFNNAENGDGGQPMRPGAFIATPTVSYLPAKSDFVGEDHDVTYDTTTVGLSDSLAMAAIETGDWTIDGTQVAVYAVPVYDGVTEMFLWMTNGSVNDAPVQITAVTSGGTSKDLSSATDTTAPLNPVLAANSITRISADLAAALDGAGITNDRVTLYVTTSAPACDLNISASYKHLGDSDRLALETSQTINGVHNSGNSTAIDDMCDFQQ